MRELETGTEYIIAGVLSFMFYAFGGHYWYIGNKQQAIINILISVLGGLFSFGIAYMVMIIIGMVKGTIMIVKGVELQQNIKK